MSNEFNLQEPNDESGQPTGIDLERMAMEFDAFVNEVSLELSVISRQLGQTPNVRTTPDVRAHSDNDPTPQQPSPAERQPRVERLPLAERKPLIERKPAPESNAPAPKVAGNIDALPESRIQAIRDRLARVNPGTSGEEMGSSKHD